MSLSIRRVARFAICNLPWLLAFPVLCYAGNLLHGALEWYAIAAYGGRVDELLRFRRAPLDLLIDFRYVSGPHQDNLVVFLAPFAFWIWLSAAGSFVLSQMRPSAPSRGLWLFFGLLPPATMSAALAVGEWAQAGSLMGIVQQRPLAPFVVAAVACPLLGVLAWRQFRRLWGGLSALEFALVYSSILAMPWVVLGAFGRAVFPSQ